MKVLVCTIPKSGTYLIAQILTQLGLRPTKLHLAENGFTNYAAADLETGRRYPDQLQVNEPFAESIKRIGDGEFAVGHLPLSTAHLLRDFEVIFAYRDIRDVLISFCRFTADTGRCQDIGNWRHLPDGPAKLLGFLEHHCHNMQKIIGLAVDWRSEQGVTQVKFEELMGDYGQRVTISALRRIANVANRSLTDSELLQNLLSAKATQTLTRSTGRSNRKQFWNSDVEMEFVRLGFAEFNSKLGFDQPSDSIWSSLNRVSVLSSHDCH